MELTGQHHLAGDVDVVWQALHDPEVLAACIPGCRALTAQDEGVLSAEVAVPVDGDPAYFRGILRSTDADAPYAMRIHGTLENEKAGSLSGAIDIRLAGEDGGTALSYDIRGEIDGRIAEAGDEPIDAAARGAIDAFFAALEEKAPESTLHRVEHAVEAVVEEATQRVQHAAHDVEEVAEDAAARGFLGGPATWALLALAVLIAGILLTR